MGGNLLEASIFKIIPHPGKKKQKQNPENIENKLPTIVKPQTNNNNKKTEIKKPTKKCHVHKRSFQERQGGGCDGASGHGLETDLILRLVLNVLWNKKFGLFIA